MAEIERWPVYLDRDGRLATAQGTEQSAWYRESCDAGYCFEAVRYSDHLSTLTQLEKEHDEACACGLGLSAMVQELEKELAEVEEERDRFDKQADELADDAIKAEAEHDALVAAIKQHRDQGPLYPAADAELYEALKTTQSPSQESKA